VTDGQTDGRTPQDGIGRTALCIAPRGIKSLAYLFYGLCAEQADCWLLVLKAKLKVKANLFISPAPSSEHSTYVYVKLFVIFSFFLLAISPRPLSRSSSILTGRWQTGCNRKFKLTLLSELFFWGDGGSKRSFCFESSFRKCNMAAKGIYLSKKERCLIFAG